MSFEPKGFLINSSKVVHESFENERVIINLETGSYFSLDPVGECIWKLLETGLSPSELLETVAREYGVAPKDIQASISNFITSLESEGLITPTTQAIAREITNPEVVSKNQPLHRLFTPPVLQKFTDMQELLLLDPVHDADETGWPSLKKPDADLH